ncbi:eukaryotic translation initiation factor 3 subunit C-like [Diadema antillarum]|uniref:eukaryotic translation initiation factor 3 subunit C-like n=1 Tax=Diadema antillarum TaxID=105358 RepID=UPI003A8854AB
MASRFFAGGSSTESDSESSDDGMPVPQSKPVPMARFFFSDDEEETKRVVRSAKSKRHDEIMDVIKQMKNQKKIRDVSRVLSSFEELTRVYAKAQNVLSSEGQYPRYYVRCLVELESFVNELWEEKKKLNKANAKALATLRQKSRKYVRESQLEEQFEKYKENPDAEKDDDEDEDEEEESGEPEEEEEKAPVQSFKKTVPKAKEERDSDDESDDSWDESMSSDSSSDDEVPAIAHLTAEYFLKKTPATTDKTSRKDRSRKKAKVREEELAEDGEAGDGEWEEVKGGIKVEKEKPKMFAKDVEITHSVVVKKLGEIVSARGKRGTNRADQIELLKELRSIARQNNLGLGIDLKIDFHIMSAIFDYNPNVAACMKTTMWEMCLELMKEMLDILVANQDIVVTENMSEDAEQLTEPPFRVRGCILTVAERLDEEFTKILQGTDAHSTEYVDRLKDETTVTNIITQLQGYLEACGISSEICRIYLRHIQHIYYKYDYEKLRELEKNRAKAKAEEEKKNKEEQKDGETDSKEAKEEEKEEKEEEKEEEEEEKEEEEKKESSEESKIEEEERDKEKKEESSLELMSRMCKYIYSKDTTDLIRTRTMLCHIYHYAIHDRWYTARDLMLMSHLQQTIQFSDIPTQILYNRTMVQLGLCAFRHGNIKDAHNALLDIQSGGRAKELLAQGLLMRQQERDAQQEKIEKSRQLPFHMHINLELLECVYLVSAMLLEIPYMASHHFDIRRRMISKSFHHQLRLSERQTLIGPPESMREHVVAASRAMRYGDWRGCKQYLINEKMNMKVWNLFQDPNHVRDLITRKIQEESLRTYLFTYGSVYDSLSLITLSEMFELEKTAVHSIVSKMIINEELMASWDEPAATIVMHRCEPTRLQHLSLRLADKVVNLVENNERLIDRGTDGRFKPRDQQGFKDRGYNKDGRGRDGYKDRGGRDRYNKDGRDRYNKDGRDRYNKDGRDRYNKDGRDRYNKDGRTGGRGRRRNPQQQNRMY